MGNTVITLTPNVINALKEAELTASRLEALYFMGKLDLIGSLAGIGPNAIGKIRQLIKASYPDYGDYSWVFNLALISHFGRYDLRTLTYKTSTTRALVDCVIPATIGTEDVVIYRLRKTLNPNESKIIEAIYRHGRETSDLAAERNVSIVRIRQIRDSAMDKIRDKKTGIVKDLMETLFIGYSQ